jgi:hypothetical protein
MSTPVWLRICGGVCEGIPGFPIADSVVRRITSLGEASYDIKVAGYDVYYIPPICMQGQLGLDNLAAPLN